MLCHDADVAMRLIARMAHALFTPVDFEDIFASARKMMMPMLILRLMMFSPRTPSRLRLRYTLYAAFICRCRHVASDATTPRHEPRDDADTRRLPYIRRSLSFS